LALAQARGVCCWLAAPVSSRGLESGPERAQAEDFAATGALGAAAVGAEEPAALWQRAPPWGRMGARPAPKRRPARLTQ
jgi:hypothetical protein